ncbi:hypothetical protein SLEP1_g1984 [Rubroshorea leprosula]|uniref:Peptidase A1 domain-containing protein n=1 Tax=Rubroshorea leprosula TaxID=152421 RepID=A0AAV5HLF4_9ROSI|nr:hypothetical protein SLEP1_g1984 [Rubroshorea leprosula]
MGDNKIIGKVPFMMVLFFLVLSCFPATVQPSINTAVQLMAGFGPSIVLPLTGNVYPRGYFELSLRIGNPPKSFTFEIDTGSDLTWVQCDADCEGCSLPKHELYKPGKAYVPFDDPLCAEIGNPGSDDPKKICSFNVTYVDGSTSGYLVRDIFTLRPDKGSTSGSSTLTFGCGNKIQSYTGEPLETAGILGLSKSVVSIPSQLRAVRETQNVIGHCLSGKSGGFLFIGNDPVPSSGVTWVPMLKKKQYYASGPADLFFDGTDIKLSHVLFDSGSTYTLFPSTIYGAILSLLSKDLIGKKLVQVPFEQDGTLPVCWRGIEPFKSQSDVKRYFKTFTLRFTKDAGLQLPPETYLVISEHGNACLGILNGTVYGVEYNLLGAISMLDKMLIYDNEKGRIGWTSGDCFPPISRTEPFSAML